MKTIESISVTCPVDNAKNVIVMEFNGDKYCPLCLSGIDDAFKHESH